MPQFITPDELKAYPLPVKAEQWFKVGDDQITIVIERASEHLEDFMDRKVLTGNYVDRLRGKGLSRQLLTHYPVTQLNVVTAYSPTNAAFDYNVSNFIVDESAGIIEWANRYRYNFYTDMVWMIDYNAGFTSVPGPIKHATALQTVKMLQPLFRGGTTFVETELIAEIDEQVVELLDPYMRRTST